MCLQPEFLPKKKKKTGLRGHVTPLEDISMPDVLISYNQIQLNEYGVTVPGVKRSGLDADHSLPTGFEIKNACK